MTPRSGTALTIPSTESIEISKSMTVFKSIEFMDAKPSSSECHCMEANRSSGINVDDSLLSFSTYGCENSKGLPTTLESQSDLALGKRSSTVTLRQECQSVFGIGSCSTMAEERECLSAFTVNADGTSRMPEENEKNKHSKPTKRRNAYIKDVSIDGDKKVLKCSQCKYVTDRKNNLKRHVITMHQNCSKTLECCGVLFESKSSLREHVVQFHSSGYQCQICGRNFCRKALLRRHLSVHSGQKDYKCPLCSYATSHKSNLERHQKVHGKKYINTRLIKDLVSDADRNNKTYLHANMGYVNTLSAGKTYSEVRPRNGYMKINNGRDLERRNIRGRSKFANAKNIKLDIGEYIHFENGCQDIRKILKDERLDNLSRYDKHYRLFAKHSSYIGHSHGKYLEKSRRRFQKSVKNKDCKNKLIKKGLDDNLIHSVSKKAGLLNKTDYDVTGDSSLFNKLCFSMNHFDTVFKNLSEESSTPQKHFTCESKTTKTLSDENFNFPLSNFAKAKPRGKLVGLKSRLCLSPYKCPECFLYFTSQTNFFNHKCDNTGKKEFLVPLTCMMLKKKELLDKK